jgi:hypothetical protein
VIQLSDGKDLKCILLKNTKSFLGGCPKATFEFNNHTKKVSYNFIDSSVGNIGSLETCPCKIVSDFLMLSIDCFFL